MSNGPRQALLVNAHHPNVYQSQSQSIILKEKSEILPAGYVTDVIHVRPLLNATEGPTLTKRF